MQVIEKCMKCGRQIPWVCFFGNSILAIFKVVVAIISGSKGLLADGLHSASDVLATAMVIISLKISHKSEDSTHPWGYGKVEYIGSLFVYTVLFFLGGYIFFDATLDIIFRRSVFPHIISLFAAMVSIVSNVILASYGFCAGKHLNSPAMMANANENKADMFSSIAVALGVLGTHAGFAFTDPLAALIVGILIIKMSVTLLIQALAGLMDRSIDKRAVDYIRRIALRQKGVSGVSYMRARKVGGKAWVELEILTDPRYSVTQANVICSEVRTAILRQAIHIKEVVISFTFDWNEAYRLIKDEPRERRFSISSLKKSLLTGFAFRRKTPAVWSKTGRR